MGLIFMLVAGAVFGWLGAFVLKLDDDLRMLQLCIAVGVAGSLIGGLVAAPLMGAGGLLGERFPIVAVLLCKLGAIVAVFILSLLHRRVLR